MGDSRPGHIRRQVVGHGEEFHVFSGGDVEINAEWIGHENKMFRSELRLAGEDRQPDGNGAR